MNNKIYILDDEPKYNSSNIEDQILSERNIWSAMVDRKNWVEKDLKSFSAYYKIPIDIIEVGGRIMGRIRKFDLMGLSERELEEKERIMKNFSQQDYEEAIANSQYKERPYFYYYDDDNTSSMTTGTITDFYLMQYLKSNPGNPYVYIVTIWTYYLNYRKKTHSKKRR